jgi:uncharacterized protein (TIGR03435 family)
MAEVATKTIQSQAHHDVELSALRIRDHLVERRTSIFRTTDAAIQGGCSIKPARCDMGRWRTRGLLVLFATVGTPLLLHSQSPQASDQKAPAFEVASIKPNTSGSSDFNITGFGTSGPRPSQFAAKNAALDRIITIAFGVRDEQLINLPGWTHTERFDIVARYPSATPYNPRNVEGMLRSLLADRFALQAHHETRDLHAYDLVLARRDRQLGPFLRPSTETSRVVAAPGVIGAHDVPLGVLVLTLSSIVQRLVVDRTGLTGAYDFELRWTPEGPAAAVASANSDSPSIFTAIEEQLGLRLQSAKAPVAVVVIDHVERPTPD